jgi:ubiquinone biosynthesis monooxygenase Coq7
VTYTDATSASTSDRSLERILRVNHAGEHGAIRIYRAQIALGRLLYPQLLPQLTEILGHEIEHETAFAGEMRRTGAKPCRLIGLWAVGGRALGYLTGLMGAWGVSVCTAAVECSVHRHLDDQIAFLEARDDQLKQVVERIQVEEVSHIDFALARHDPKTLPARVLAKAVEITTELLIIATTRGEARQMHRDIARRDR